MDPRQEKAIRDIMRKATDAICAVLHVSPERLPPVSPDDLRITETITDALAKEGVTEADIQAAKG